MNFKIVLNLFKKNFFFLVMAKLKFQHALLQWCMILQKSFQYADLGLKKHLKTDIFCGNYATLFSGFFYK